MTPQQQLVRDLARQIGFKAGQDARNRMTANELEREIVRAEGRMLEASGVEYTRLSAYVRGLKRPY